MGNSPPRRVTVVNDDSVGIVQISESVVQRLRTDPRHKSEKPQSESQNVDEPPTGSEPVPMPPPPQPQIPAAEAYASTLEQRKKFNEEFRRAEESWSKRVKELQRQNRALYEAAENRLAAEIAKVEDNYMKQSLAAVCPDKQSEVEKCYRSNLKTPLNCAKCVKDYMNCLDETRLKIISPLT